MDHEFKKVLSNWIKEATSYGELPEGKNVEEWIAEQVVNWWRPKINDDIESLKTTASCLRKNLEKIGGWNRKELADAMHELIHLEENITDLRSSLCLEAENYKDEEQKRKGDNIEGN